MDPLVDIGRQLGLFYKELRKQGVGRHLAAELTIKMLSQMAEMAKGGNK